MQSFKKFFISLFAPFRSPTRKALCKKKFGEALYILGFKPMDFNGHVLDLIMKRQISSALNCNNSMFCIRE